MITVPGHIKSRELDLLIGRQELIMRDLRGSAKDNWMLWRELVYIRYELADRTDDDNAKRGCEYVWNLVEQSQWARLAELIK